jgi:hypothetical protein
MSIGSARSLHSSATDLANWIAAHPEQEVETPLGALEALSESGVLLRLLDLSEANDVIRRTPRPRRNAPVGDRLPVDVAALARDWVSGMGLDALATSYLSAIEDRAHRAEALVEYLTALFENYLPWALSHVVPWANEALEGQNQAGVVSPDLGLHLQWGVRGVFGIALMRGGVRARRVVTRIEALAEQEGIGEDDLQQWLGQKGVRELVALLELNRAELNDLTSFARIATGRGLGTLLAGNLWTVEIPGAAIPLGAVEVEIREDDQQFGYVLFDSQSGAELVDVPTPAVEDIRAILGSGLLVSMEVPADDDPVDPSAVRTLTVRLLEFDTEATDQET